MVIVMGLLFITYSVPSISGQVLWNVALTTSAGHSDNFIRSALGGAQSFVNTDLFVSAEHNNSWRSVLDLGITEPFSNTDYRSGFAEYGLQYRSLYRSKLQFFAGGNLGRQVYAPAYDYYNSNYGGLYYQAKYYYRSSGSVQLNSALDFILYDDVPEADQLRLGASLSLNQSFPWRGSLRLEPILKRQSFKTMNTFESTSRHSGVWISSALPTRTLTGYNLRLSQSISPSLGATLWVKGQNTESSTPQSMVVLDARENPFVDEFTWSGQQISARLQARSESRLSASIFTSYSTRTYTDLPIYEYDFDLGEYAQTETGYIQLPGDREDHLTNYQIQLNWDLSQPVSLWLENVYLTASLGWQNNESTDPLYVYSGIHSNVSIQYSY